MKFGFLSSVLVLLALGLTSCGTTNNSSTVAGSGILYATTQGNASVSAFGIALSTGALATNGNAVATGAKASAIVISPAGDAIFVANSQDNNISGFTVNSDGTLKSSGSPTSSPGAPVAMAIDPGGKFLFVANQSSGTIAVFAVKGAALTAMGSFSTATPGVTVPTGPVSLAVSSNGNYLYVANQFTNTVSGYAVSSGVLTLVGGSPFPVGISPSAVALTPDGNFLYVGNSGSNNVSAFAACTNANLTCVTPTGALNPVAGSPFPAGLGPIAMVVAADAHGEYLFVANHASNEVSQYKVGVGNGTLTTQTPIAVSTGSGPSAIAVRAGSGTVLTTGGTTNYVYVANSSAATISVFSYDTLTGILTVVGSPVTTAGQPSGLVVK